MVDLREDVRRMEHSLVVVAGGAGDEWFPGIVPPVNP